MFQIETMTAATLTSVTPRTETHGPDRVFAISLGLKLTCANTMLDKLSPQLRDALYEAPEGQEDLPGVERSTPLRRCKIVQEVILGPSNLEGYTIAIDHGIDEDDLITLGGCKVDKVRCIPKEGGSIELMFRIGSNDIDATEAGLLCSHLSQEISFTLKAPEKPAEPIDGTKEAFEKDHPEAGELFAGTITGDGSGEALAPVDEQPTDESRVGWPFAEGSGAPQVERSQPGTRTARGRERTKKALAEGATQ